MLDAADEVLSPRGLVVDRYTGPLALIDDTGRVHALPVAAPRQEVVLGSEEALREAAEEAHQARPRAEVRRPARTQGDFFDPPALLPVVKPLPAKRGRAPRTRRERLRQRERGGR
jgi:hypothetical protein